MNALERRFGARGLRVVSVTRHGEDADDRELVASTAKKHGMTSPSFLDVDGSWSKKSGLVGAPSFLVVGRAGSAFYRHVGRLSEGTPQYEAIAGAIEAALRDTKGNEG